MSEENKELLDTQNQDGEENSDQNLKSQSEENKSDDTIILSKKEYESLKGQKEYYQTKYKDIKNKPAEKQVKTESISDDRTIVLELRQDYPQLTKEEAFEIAQKAMKISSIEGKSIDESLNDEYIKTIINNKINQKASEDASISSSRSPRFIANNVEFKAGMSDEDHKKAWAKANGLA